MPVAALGGTYAARVRWTPAPTGTSAAGYRIYHRVVPGRYGAPQDVGVPALAPDGSMGATVAALAVQAEHRFVVTAYGSDGSESGYSNEIALGYVDVAGVVDSDADGLTEAAEDVDLDGVVDAGETDPSDPDSDDDGVPDGADACQATAPRAAVDGRGCSCAQIPPCDDREPCTTDSCVAGTCRYASVPDGGSCSDGDACNGAETCQSGRCTAGTALACDDANACTTDSCDPSSGCRHAGVADCCASDEDCADADACTVSERCTAGRCTSAPLACADPGACRQSTCEPDRGCIVRVAPDGTACDDADVCTSADTCVGGTCTGTAAAFAGATTPGVTVRRFSLRRTRDGGYALAASATFPYPRGTDLTLAGLGIAVTSPDGPRPLAVEVPGASIVGSTGACVAAGAGAPGNPGLERVYVRSVGSSARVRMRAILPAFPFGSGALHWQLRFGTACTQPAVLRCQERRDGARRCR